MEKYKKTLFILASVGILLVVGANIFAEWINCSEIFPGTCTVGGCRDPQYAVDCWLMNCMNTVGNNIQCGHPPNVR